jgi:peptide/nickel transport system permease protein
MTEYVVRRLLSMIPVLFIVSVIAFSLLYVLPGDPVIALLGEEYGDEQMYLEMKEEMGLNDPLPVQYLKWLGRVLRGDFGKSTRNQQPVSEILKRRIPVSVNVGLAGIFVSLLIGIPMAIISALKPGRIMDSLATFLALSGIAIPGFWLGIMLMYFFAVQLRWLPPSGYTRFFENPVLSIKMMIMPAISIGFRASAVIMRQGRAALINVLKQDYITTARAKGLREKLVIYRHALKNAMIPVVTILGMQVGHIVAGAAITETVFAIPGVGRVAVDAIYFRDYHVLQGAVIVLTIGAMLGNLLADLTYAYLDPRIRYR